MKLKYKTGDKVKVKSIDWYNANRDKNGYVHCQGTLYFIPQMLDFCGKIVTIDEVWWDECYIIQEADQDFEWNDDMFEDY
jgi:hypothetical protein